MTLYTELHKVVGASSVNTNRVNQRRSQIKGDQQLQHAVKCVFRQCVPAVISHGLQEVHTVIGPYEQAQS